jgi:hypothetical protein
MKTTPSAKSSFSFSAAAKATVVLPIPPGPVTDTHRRRSRLASISETTSSRPTTRAMERGSGGSALMPEGVSASGLGGASGLCSASTAPTNE